jgi:hypothetical protein
MHVAMPLKKWNFSLGVFAKLGSRAAMVASLIKKGNLKNAG